MGRERPDRWPTTPSCCGACGRRRACARRACRYKPPISNEQGLWWDSFSPTAARPRRARATGLTQHVSPGYFATIGIADRAGRDFALGDRDGSPRVVIINASLARTVLRP